ncbi:PepSY-like domain-containing protein [Catalinimonas niigatensis]|uniref:PepSY-like domain-containing protein n=1 Tax=Catalinimonas niigatensis TaxID=1397264 RepID=UPI0026666530|nr:PepSY-like domain-containing protein [Catalinimonas niigatensis]WPP48499.1 PepSY-like domain-containing protein [Catalinimonas niigatensis]
MKRTIIAIAAIGTFSFATIETNAQAIDKETETVFVQDQRTEIQYEELPDAVSTAFEESQYGQWEVSQVHEVGTEQGTQYELTITDGTQNGTLSFDEEGNMIQ